MLYRLFFVLSCVSLLLVSCGGGEVKKDASGREDFEAFYKRFHEDTLFQFQRIEFPLAGLKSDGTETIWTEENWVLLKPVDFNSEDFKVFRDAQGDFIKERVVYQDVFLIERNFSYDTKAGKWLLTYYAEPHFPQSNKPKGTVTQSDSGTVITIPGDQPAADTTKK